MLAAFALFLFHDSFRPLNSISDGRRASSDVPLRPLYCFFLFDHYVRGPLKIAAADKWIMLKLKRYVHPGMMNPATNVMANILT